MHLKKISVALVALALPAQIINPTFAAETSQTKDSSCLVYVGTYTGSKSKGIYALRLEEANGALTPLGLVAETRNPSFLDIDQKHRLLFAVNEISKFDGKSAGAVSSFTIDESSGKLTFLNQESSGGAGPCHLLLDAACRKVFVANYGGGSVAVLPVGENGHLAAASAFVQHNGKSVNPSRQEGPHAHCATLDAANRFAFVCDLGLDEILSYKFDTHNGTLTPNEPPFASVKPGSGPRHLVFHPDGRHAYAISELSSTITAFDYDANHGTLAELQTVSTLPDDFKGNNGAAEIEVHPSGNFLYGSNRGHNSIVVYAINPDDGKLTLVEHQATLGKTPRHFTIDPSGKYLLVANQDSDSVVVFSIDTATGKLKPTGETATVPTPVC